MTTRRTNWRLGASALVALLLTTFTPSVANAAEPTAQFNMSTTTARPGQRVTFTQNDPCPEMPETAYDQVAEFTFTDAAGTQMSGGVQTNADGTWRIFPGGTAYIIVNNRIITPSNPPTTSQEVAAAGTGTVTGRCVVYNSDQTQTVVQEYAPQSLTVSGEPVQFSMSATSGQPGDTIEIESVEPCPSDRLGGSIHGTQALSGFTYMPGSLGAGGAWSISVPLSSENMDGTRTPLPAGKYVASIYCMDDTTASMTLKYADQVVTVGETAPPAPNCRDVIFIAAAGSGQAFDGGTNLSISPEIERAYNGFRQVLPADKKIRKRVLNYPALPVSTLTENLDGVDVTNAKAVFDKNIDKYLQGKNAGVNRLFSVMSEVRQSCPDQAVVLAGYSQGALVVHEFLQQYALTSGPDKRAIKAVILLADPARVADSGVIDFGDAPFNSQGICQFLGGLVKCMKTAQLADIPELYRTRTTSVCLNLDAVCDTSNMVGTLWPLGYQSAFETGSRVHTEYHITPEVTTAGKRAARQVMNRS